jgi:hypothetical protein
MGYKIFRGRGAGGGGQHNRHSTPPSTLHTFSSHSATYGSTSMNGLPVRISRSSPRISATRVLPGRCGSVEVARVCVWPPRACSRCLVMHSRCLVDARKLPGSCLEAAYQGGCGPRACTHALHAFVLRWCVVVVVFVVAGAHTAYCCCKGHTRLARCVPTRGSRSTRLRSWARTVEETERFGSVNRHLFGCGLGVPLTALVVVKQCQRSMTDGMTRWNDG